MTRPHHRTASATNDPAGTLADLEHLADLSRRTGLASATGRPLIVWGAAWLLGYVALGLSPDARGIAIGGACSLAAILASWRGGPGAARTGWEPRMRAAWLVLMAGSPLLVAIAQPTGVAVVALLLGGLWSLGLALYGVASGDGPLVALGLALLLAATAASLTGRDAALVAYGLVSGAAMLGFGGRRVRRQPRGRAS